jgi:hypothetical protein
MYGLFLVSYMCPKHNLGPKSKQNILVENILFKFSVFLRDYFFIFQNNVRRPRINLCTPTKLKYILAAAPEPVCGVQVRQSDRMVRDDCVHTVSDGYVMYRLFLVSYMCPKNIWVPCMERYILVENFLFSLRLFVSSSKKMSDDPDTFMHTHETEIYSCSSTLTSMRRPSTVIW